ncbi:MAG: hypothetical protein RL018_1263 [Pseudomonadota bacterium]
MSKETNSVEHTLKLALEALKEGDWYIGQLETIVYSSDDDGIHGNRAKVQEAIKALEEALAKQEQGEPAMTVRVWRDKHGDQTAEFRNWHTLSDGEHSLYTTPQQRTWVGLTDREKSNLWLESRAAIPRFHTYASLVEAKLKEKNT